MPREDSKQRRTSATSGSATSSSAYTRNISTDASHGSLTTSASTSIDSSSRQRSPFTILTGLIDRPMASEPHDWMLDLQLMHHYTTHTRYVLTESRDMAGLLRIWQEEAPKVAFKADYCMHAILGFTALHKAHLEPENAIMLRTSAVDHLDKALVRYREHGAVTTAENADAKFAFTWVVVLFAYAVPPSVPPIDAIVELFLLVKGIDSVLADGWFWVSQGPFAPILAGGFQEAITHEPNQDYTLPEGMDFGLNHLDYMLGVDAMMPDDRRICALILAELKTVYDNVLGRNGSTSVASIVCFPRQDSAPFSSLIRRRVPQALVILAYYCVLLDVLDTRWWMHGWSRRVLRDVISTLPENWQSWIEWPMQAVLMKPQSMGTTDSTNQLGLLI